MTTYGYARDSDRGAMPHGQVKQLTASGCRQVFTDTGSPQELRDGWAALVATVQRGDTVRITSWDRVTRRADTAEFIAATLGDLGVTIEELPNQPGDTP